VAMAPFAVRRLAWAVRISDWYWKDSSLWYALVF
jgi:hypothetical protein